MKRNSKQINRKWQVLLLMAFSSIMAWGYPAIVLGPDAKVSLLTCSPGKELYSSFGHTAIRITDPQADMDYVFNYGIFDPEIENFYLRFVKGETDYKLGLTSYRFFHRAYTEGGRTIFEQTLALDSLGKQQIYDALWENYRPENRSYRYNFVFDNCATRPYQLIRNNMDGVLVNMQFAERKDTYRQIIAHYTNPDSWMFFGIDLIFGKKADVVMTTEQRMFLPEELMLFMAGADVYKGDSVTEAVDSQFVGQFITPTINQWASPKVMMVLLIFFFALLSLAQTFRKRFSFFFDAILYFVMGVEGIIAFYLAFFSIHPLVDHNYNLLLFNPLLFILFVLTLFAKGRQLLRRIQVGVLVYVAMALLLRTMVMQATNWMFITVAVILMLRAWTCLRIKQGKTLFPVIRRRVMVSALVVIMASFTAMAQQAPRLTVCVVVDGLNNDNLQRMQHYFDKGGFRLLQEQASLYEQMTFPQMTFGGDETMATLSTGTVPCVHGMMASKAFDRTTRTAQTSLYDKQEQGIGTDVKLSPRQLLAPTFTDMHRMQWGKDAKIYSVGIQAQPTMLLGGHAADAAVWMDQAQCGWATSTYYPNGLPSEAYQMNGDGTFRAKATEMWTPRFPTMGLYLNASEQERKNGGFIYKAFSDNSRDKCNALLFNMPAANQLVVDLAIRLLKSRELGKDLIPDLLCLQLTTVTPGAYGDVFASAEQEDMYMRLNECLGQLLDALEKQVDRNHLMVVVTGRPMRGMANEQMKAARIQTGDFDLSRSVALINTYLMAMHGHERWIDGTYKNQIFLNRTLIEKKKMDLRELQRKTADFLMEFEGVKMAYTTSEIHVLADDVYGETRALRNSYYRPAGGDIIFTLQTGWTLLDDGQKSADLIMEPNPAVPCFVLSKDRTPQQHAKAITATQIAPFICKTTKSPFTGYNTETLSIEHVK